MKIVVAPDSFKESLSAVEACEAICRGILKVYPEAELIKVPMADGGEGTVNTLVQATQGKIIACEVHDPLMRKVKGYFGILGDGETAVVEVAVASGLELLKKDERNPLKTTSFGTGELLKHAMDYGCRKIIVGLGGSAINDGGAGMMMALGARLTDQDGRPIKMGGEGLADLQDIDLGQLDSRIIETAFLVACDVNNPLTGERGASRVFGPQKGATSAMIKVLDEGLSHYGELIRKITGRAVAEIPGAGAAGGLGAGLMAFLKAKLQPGFGLLSTYTKLEEKIKNSSLVITAEGRTDAQTLSGKVPYGVSLMGKKYKVPVLVFAGDLGSGSDKLLQEGATEILCIRPGTVSVEDSIKNASLFLQKTVETKMKDLRNKK